MSKYNTGALHITNG